MKFSVTRCDNEFFIIAMTFMDVHIHVYHIHIAMSDNKPLSVQSFPSSSSSYNEYYNYMHRRVYIKKNEG